MLFNSFEFLLFFPIVTILYYCLPHKYRWLFLLIVSCIFYLFAIPIYILVLFTTIIIDYFAAIGISKSAGKARKNYLILSIVSTCLVLFIFKYFNFFNENFRLLAHLLDWNYPIPYLNILLPIGLSFHTFQSLNYVIEVYRGDQKPEYHFGIYSLYVMFYPQLVAGPIERPQNLLHQFYEKHDFSYENVTQGLKQMLWGFFKKVVVADRLSIYVNAVYNNQSHHNGNSLALASLFFSFQIYCDFSGYSDIAIGAARVMGFKLMTNFNRPFLSKSVTEYWRRWHISLTTWFNNYLFTPIMVSTRNWHSSVVFALLITFFLSGLWHGADWTYVVFGVINGIAVSYELLTKKLRRKILAKLPTIITEILSILLTFIFACFTFIFFRSGNVKTALQIINKIFLVRGPLFVADLNWLMVYAAFAVLIVMVTEISEEYGLFPKFRPFQHKNVIVRYMSYCFLIIIILLIGVFDKNQFIYFQF